MPEVGVRDADINGLVNTLRSLTEQLTALHGELYWQAMQPENSIINDAHTGEPNVELLTALKGAVDDIRMLLWNYIEAASEVDAGRVQAGLEAQKLQRMTHFLELLRKRLGRNPDEQPLSFIEKISAAVNERLGDKVA